MDCLNYLSDDDEIDEKPSVIIDYWSSDNHPVKIDILQQFNAAPQPLIKVSKSATSSVSSMILSNHPPLGPKSPFSSDSQTSKKNGHNVTDVFIDDFFFNKSYNDYSSNNESYKVIDNVPKSKEKKRKYYDDNKDIQGDDLYKGPWAPIANLPEIMPTADEKIVQTECSSNFRASKDICDVVIPNNMYIVEPEKEDEKWEKLNERKQSFVLPPRPCRGDIAVNAKSTFHGNEEKDYLGRSWNSVPSELKHASEQSHESFIPSKCTHKFVGHSKGVQVIELFPKFGHLLLSGCLDGKLKIWDVVNTKKVLRTYEGHTEGVRSVHMSNDGSQFLSSGFDRYVRLWDLETGQAVSTFTNRKMNYQVKFYPNDNNVFLCAASDNRIYQWDCRTGKIIQEYNYHLQGCNTITFFDEGRKFVSSSDDKKLLVWEYDIPVPIKYIAEPEMHSIPTITLHPSGSYFCGQSMNNEIVTYTCGEKVNQLKKKNFRGHNNAGFACQIGFSHNGQFVVSGDGKGKLHFWDWKTTKEYRKFQAHDNGPCICSVWHPVFPSTVFTCGWDGLIKMWQ